MKRPTLLRCLCLVCLVCLVGPLSGCAPGGPAPLQDKVSLSLMVPSEYQDLYNPALEKFKKQEPNITVETRSQGFSDQLGDVTLIRWYMLNSTSQTEADQILDLTPLIQQDRAFKPEDYIPGALDTFKVGNKLLALPTGVDPSVIFYNQDLFDRMGVPYPKPGWTWEEFRATAEKLTDVGAGYFGYRPSERYFDALFFVHQNGGSVFNSQGEVRLDGPETVKAVEWYVSLFGPDGPAAIASQMRTAYGEGGGNVGVVSGKIGMWMDSVSGLESQFGGAIKFKVGIAPLPHGEKNLSLAQYEGLAIQAATKNPQAAWRLVNFLSGQPNSWVYPARASLADSPIFLNAFGKEKAAGVRAALENATVTQGLDFPRFNSMEMAFTYAVSTAIEQGVPAAEALSRAQDDIQH
jgi:ABC-type glycerol-3-phosphate transport system substrate-binding protein